eukprot:81070_1
MSLLSIVCDEMGLKHVRISSLENSKTLPQTWIEFMSLNEAQSKKCQESILNTVNLDSNTVNRIWFNMHYLALYHHFNIKEHIRCDITQELLCAFTELLSRHPAIIKNSMFVIRMEWSDIATAINAKRNKKRPQSPWGSIPSLSLPADPSAFKDFIWPNIPFQLQIPQTVKQYLKNAADKLTVVYLKALDLAAIALFGLSRNDELDQWFIRYYQKHGDSIRYTLEESKQNDADTTTTTTKHCHLKTCASYHRLCLLMHLHGKWTENALMKQKLVNKAKHEEDSKIDDDGTGNPSNHLKNYVKNYLGMDFDAETAFNDIDHVQQKHIDLWVTMDEKKVMKKRLSHCEDIDEDALLTDDNSREELLKRYQDIRLFCEDLNETRASFCGEFVCGLLKSRDIKQIEKDLEAIKNDKIKMKHPTMLTQNEYNDLNHLCTNLHKSLFHGYSVFHGLKKYRLMAFKMNPDRLRKQEAAIRVEMQNKLRAQIQAKMRQRTV